MGVIMHLCIVNKEKQNTQNQKVLIMDINHHFQIKNPNKFKNIKLGKEGIQVQ
jgi:hypothetical protein